MGFDISIRSGFFLLIIIAGVLSTVTDLFHKKIRNSHLIIIAVAALVLTIIKGLSDKSLPILQLSSTGCAIIIAWILYINDLWRGGDAKLFVSFSFLMPVTGYEAKFFFPCIALFFNTFIIALIFVSLSWFKNVLINPKLVLEQVADHLRLSTIIQAISATACISWVIFPLFSIFGLMKYGSWSFLIFYLIISSIGKQITKLVENKFFVVTVFLCGLFLRYAFSPSFFLWKNIISYLYNLIIYFLGAYTLHRVTISIEGTKDRVPFAPFLLLGCLFSYTPLLWWIMALQHLGK